MAVAAERSVYHQTPPQQDGRKPLYYETFVGFDIVELLASNVWRGKEIPPGDGSSVIVVPGYGSNDFHTKAIRSWLGRMGYDDIPSGITIANFDPEFFEKRITEKVDEAFSDSGKKVHLVGHSLGGVMVRVIAARRPDKVKSVTTLGSPLYGEPEEVVAPFILIPARLSIPLLRNRERLAQRKREISRSLRHKGVRITSIYTKGDGVVDWRYCVDPDPDVKNIEVQGTHAGLIFNPQAYNHLGQILAKPQLAEATDFLSLSKSAA